MIAGGLRAETAPAGSPQARRIFNSLLVFGEGGRLLAAYDKVHLVPFGEYLPFQSALEALGLQQLARLRGGFATGVTPRPLLHLPGLPALAPLICYEVIFPGAIVAGTERPSLLLNLTNDGWFGNTSGPRQHLQQARVRAVEEGLPLVRAANNGISAMVDGAWPGSRGTRARSAGLGRCPADGTATTNALCPLWGWLFLPVSGFAEQRCWPSAAARRVGRLITRPEPRADRCSAPEVDALPICTYQLQTKWQDGRG